MAGQLAGWEMLGDTTWPVKLLNSENRIGDGGVEECNLWSGIERVVIEDTEGEADIKAPAS